MHAGHAYKYRLPTGVPRYLTDNQSSPRGTGRYSVEFIANMFAGLAADAFSQIDDHHPVGHRFCSSPDSLSILPLARIFHELT
jgi:hypothetical protein